MVIIKINESSDVRENIRLETKERLHNLMNKLALNNSKSKKLKVIPLEPELDEFLNFLKDTNPDIPSTTWIILKGLRLYLEQLEKSL